MERLTVFVEKILSTKIGTIIFTIVSMLGVVFFCGTVYDAFFGSMEVFIGLKSQRTV